MLTKDQVAKAMGYVSKADQIALKANDMEVYGLFAELQAELVKIREQRPDAVETPKKSSKSTSKEGANLKPS
jgi:hypothetical protein